MKWLIALLAAFWLISLEYDTTALMLWPIAGDSFELWQPYTYWTQHVGLLHLLSNLGMLYWIGPTLEKRVSKYGLFVVWTACTTISAMVYSLFDTENVVAGCSAGVAGMVMMVLCTNGHKKVWKTTLGRLKIPMVITQTGMALIWPEQFLHLLGMGIGFWCYVMMNKRLRLVVG